MGFRDETIASLIGDLARLLRRRFDERARAIGVTRSQWLVLSLLSRHEGIHQARLAELLVVEPISLCRMVDRLEQAGLVERRRDPADRRAWRLFLTPTANRLLDQLTPLARELAAALLSGIEPEEERLLRRLLKRLRDNLADAQEDALVRDPIDRQEAPQ